MTGSFASTIARARSEASWQQWLLIGIAVLSAVGMRIALAPNFTSDHTVYTGPWIQELRAGGFSALGEDFANYNPPYLYLLYLGTLLPFADDLTIVKLISAGFDLLLAAGVGALVHRLRGSVVIGALAGVAALFVPEVFLNSALWGQVDSAFTALLVWSMVFLLRRGAVGAWVCFALALSFKLQAIFFLPWLAVAFIVQRHRWRAVVIGALALAMTYVPALLAGRSPVSLALIYLKQAGGQDQLSASVANLYQWVPESFFDTVMPAGMFFGLGVVALLSMALLRRAETLEQADRWLLRVAAAVGTVVPFVLPQMHERYFYAGGVFALLCVLLDRRYAVPALALQFTALCAYSPFLFGAELLPLPLAAIVQLVAVGWTVALALGLVPDRRPLPLALELPRPRADPAPTGGPSALIPVQATAERPAAAVHAG
jgi:Gpi18-like mannosyltransferase